MTVNYDIKNHQHEDNCCINTTDGGGGVGGGITTSTNTTANGEQRLDIIIKLLPHDPFSRYFVTEAQFDLREIKFYTTVSKNILKKHPLNQT